MADGATIFDLDDTLVIEEEVARASMRHTARLLEGRDPGRVEVVVLTTARRLWRAGPYRQLCWDLGIASWEGLWATFEGGHPVLDGLKDWAPAYRTEVWQMTVATLGMSDPELAGAMSDAYIESQRHGHVLIDGADRTVRAVKRSGRLGLLTNGPADIQRLKIEGTGLAGCFDAVVVSGEVGRGKPDPAVFIHALDQLGAEAKTTVMVGDSWERDVLGALSVGMSAVWVAGGRTRPETVPGVSVIDSVAQLSDVMG